MHGSGFLILQAIPIQDPNLLAPSHNLYSPATTPMHAPPATDPMEVADLLKQSQAKDRVHISILSVSV